MQKKTPTRFEFIKWYLLKICDKGHHTYFNLKLSHEGLDSLYHGKGYEELIESGHAKLKKINEYDSSLPQKVHRAMPTIHPPSNHPARHHRRPAYPGQGRPGWGCPRSGQAPPARGNVCRSDRVPGGKALPALAAFSAGEPALGGHSSWNPIPLRTSGSWPSRS